jgi:hypothetical protein
MTLLLTDRKTFFTFQVFTSSRITVNFPFSNWVNPSYYDNTVLIFSPKYDGGKFVAIYNTTSIYWSSTVPGGYDGNWSPTGVVVPATNKFVVLPKSSTGFVSIYDFSTKGWSHVIPPSACYPGGSYVLKESFVISNVNSPCYGNSSLFKSR